MFNLNDLLIYVSITLALCSVGTQILKTFFKTIVTGKFNRKMLTADGDFPSSHSSLVTGVCYILWFFTIKYYNSESVIYVFIVLFCSAFTVFALITIRDSTGVRRTVGIHGECLRKMVNSNNNTLIELYEKIPELNDDVKNDIQENFNYIEKSLNIKSGHLPHEVVGGVFWGIIISVTTTMHYFKNYTIFFLGLLVILIYIISMTIFLKKGTFLLKKIMKE